MTSEPIISKSFRLTQIKASKRWLILYTYIAVFFHFYLGVWFCIIRPKGRRACFCKMYSRLRSISNNRARERSERLAWSACCVIICSSLLVLLRSVRDIAQQMILLLILRYGGAEWCCRMADGGRWPASPSSWQAVLSWEREVPAPPMPTFVPQRIELLAFY